MGFCFYLVLLLQRAECTAGGSTANGATCDIHVNTAGNDIAGCGQNDSTACATIQTGINEADKLTVQTGVISIVCVHEGTYGCTNLYKGYFWAAIISKNLVIRGLGAGPIIDCQGAGGGFRIGSGSSTIIDKVAITGFHFRNAVGQFAGGVDAIGIRDISVISSTFSRCSGSEAGAIALHSPQGWDNSYWQLRTF